MISSQYSSAPRLRLPLLMRLRMMSISAAPGFTTSGESSYIVRYRSLQTISRPLVSNKTTPCVMLFKVSANNLASGLRAWRPIKRLRAPNMVPRASKLPPIDCSYRTSIYASLINSNTHPAVDHQQAAGGEARRVGGEKQHRARDFLGTDMTVQRNDLVEELSSVAADQSAQFLFDAQLKRVVDRTGMNGIHPDIAPGQFLGQDAHQSDLGVLC